MTFLLWLFFTMSMFNSLITHSYLKDIIKELKRQGKCPDCNGRVTVDGCYCKEKS